MCGARMLQPRHHAAAVRQSPLQTTVESGTTYTGCGTNGIHVCTSHQKTRCPLVHGHLPGHLPASSCELLLHLHLPLELLDPCLARMEG
jgi:hypothetical protein